MIQWYNLQHSELTPVQLYAVLKLRHSVFVVEQNCIYQDMDDKDLVGENRHLLGIHGDDIVAYARILNSDNSLNAVVIGRVIVSSPWRGQGLGEQLMRFALCVCHQHWPSKTLFLSAQAHLAHFYTRFGFVAVTPEYHEDGIRHIDMQKKP